MITIDVFRQIDTFIYEKKSSKKSICDDLFHFGVLLPECFHVLRGYTKSTEPRAPGGEGLGTPHDLNTAAAFYIGYKANENDIYIHISRTRHEKRFY